MAKRDQGVEENRKRPYRPQGTTRNNRFPYALRPDYFLIDDRTIADFLVFTERYAAYVRILGYAETEEREGAAMKEGESWSAFFNQDVSVFLARLGWGKPVKTATYHWRPGSSRPQHHIEHKLRDYVRAVQMLAVRVPQEVHMRQQNLMLQNLLALLEELDHAIVRIHGYLERLGIEGLLLPPGLLARQADVVPDAEVVDFAHLESYLDDFLAQANKVVSLARQCFDLSLQEDPFHDPAMGLYMAFLQLYQYVQQDLNAITKKHLDYYYRDVLGQRRKPAEPDAVHVCLRLSEHVESYVLERGALFKAGVDEEGHDVLYQASDYTRLSRTKVMSLGSIYLSYKAEIGIEPHYSFVSSIWESDILASPLGGFSFVNQPRPFSAFGEEQYDAKLKTMRPSQIGFAVASPILLLKEGHRVITVTLQFNIKSMATLLAFFERHSKRLGFGADDVFHSIFGQAFRISLSTEKGWYNLEEYVVQPPTWGSGQVQFVLTLPMGAPPVTPMLGDNWTPEETQGYQTNWPVLKMCISDEKAMYTYSYLQHLVITQCRIDVDVDRVKNLELYNDLGKVDSSTPFYPFGPAPVPGSAIMIGYEELYRKSITNLTFRIQWHNLPRTPGGFSEYYAGYHANIDNESFQVEITGLSDFEFHPRQKDKIQRAPLFFTESKDEQSSERRPAAVTDLPIRDIDALRINNNVIAGALPPYDNAAKTGYIRLELVAPEMGFGHQDYPGLVATVALRKMRDPAHALPNPPYVPQMKSLSLDYRATSIIQFDYGASVKANPLAQEKVYQLQPYGVRTIFQHATPITDQLFPQYQHQGYLLIGLDTVLPGEPLSLYFGLEETMLTEHDVPLPQVDWYYVSDDNWIPFDRRDILADTTHHFVRSGIVKLVVPQTITKENNILPRGQYWLIAALQGDARFTGKIRAVYANGALLTWTPNKPGAVWTQHILPDRVQSMAPMRPEIATILQPFPSFGGRPEEEDRNFYNRVSERLAHKNRGVTARDIESLVLERFPGVHQVKCISALEFEEWVPAGSVVVVVVPPTKPSENFVPPRFDLGELRDMKQYIEGHISPFVQVQVVNPSYEQVKVTAKITLDPDFKEGVYEDQLHRELRDFICPWYMEASRDIYFGGWLDLDDVVDFLLGRPYVQSCSQVSIVAVHYQEQQYALSDSVTTLDVDKRIYASRPWAVLVPMKNHHIIFSDSESFLPPEKAAIENMRLGNEFVVQPHPAKDEAPQTTSAELQEGYVTFYIPG